MDKTKTILVTGGAGFIGSHLVEKLARSARKVVVLDNLRTGKTSNLKTVMEKANFTFIRGDLLDRAILREALKDVEAVFHLAANPETSVGSFDTSVDFEQNLVATHNLLDEMSRVGKAKRIAFTSTSTIYGEAETMPTPEDYGPLVPISLYGASKLGCEALITAYCHMFDFQTVIYRFANVVGTRNSHGVVYDFIKKLRNNPRELEILGDGSQSKSYMYVTDCVEAFLVGLRNLDERVRILNVGSEDQVDVMTIARIVVEEMGLKDVRLRPIGGFEGRGWKGDVKRMLLDASKIRALGWRPAYGSAEAIRQAAKHALRGM